MSGVLGYFGLATGPAPDPDGQDDAAVPAADDPQAPTEPGIRPAPGRRVGRPATVGAPIQHAPASDELGVTTWVTQPLVSADGGTAGRLTVRAASVCGRRHARRGETREDSYAVGTTEDGWVIVAVADGVGDPDARYSAVGAMSASRDACRIVGSTLEAGRDVDPAKVCRQLDSEMLQSAARLIDARIDDEQWLATTLTITWISPGGDFAGFSVGDGGVFILTGGGFASLGADSTAAFTDTGGTLPRQHSVIRPFRGVLRSGTALLLVTDGLAGPLRASDVAHHLAERWSRPPTPLEFVDDISFERRGESDDRTAACIWLDGDRRTGGP